jgi:hypothetical protein
MNADKIALIILSAFIHAPYKLIRRRQCVIAAFLFSIIISLKLLIY